MSSGRILAGILTPTVALCLGVVAIMAWCVLFLVRNDAVKAKPRRRPH